MIQANFLAIIGPISQSICALLLLVQVKYFLAKLHDLISPTEKNRSLNAVTKIEKKIAPNLAAWKRRSPSV